MTALSGNSSGGKRPRECGVDEERFPLLGKCCAESRSTGYAGICPCCRIKTFPPNGGSLLVATIFECGRYGYGRRLRERESERRD